MSRSRVLTKEERRIVVDALRAAAAATRRAKADAQALTILDTATRTKHVEELSRLAGTQDRLAVEINELEVRLEKLES